jgi:hypothetical protein
VPQHVGIDLQIGALRTGKPRKCPHTILVVIGLRNRIIPLFAKIALASVQVWGAKHWRR